MPDWSYHPIFKPLLRRMRPALARDATWMALHLQGKSALGQWLFKQMSPEPLTAEAAFEKAGVAFRGPVGLGPSINPEARALAFLQDHFQFGFLELGPVHAAACKESPDREPLLLPEALGLITSEAVDPLGAAEWRNVLASVPHSIPIGLALGDDAALALPLVESEAEFFTLPWHSDLSLQWSSLRALTSKPLLLRLPSDFDLGIHHGLLSKLIENGLQGFVAVEGERVLARAEGLIESPALEPTALALIRKLREAFGQGPLILGGGGISSPESALAFQRAGADAVRVTSGFVFAGPGLPCRINEVWSGAPQIQAGPAEAPLPQTGFLLGALMIRFTGWVLIASGLFALILAGTTKLLPPDIHYLGMSMQDLCAQNACRVVHFMAHDRVSFGGSIISIGLIYDYLGGTPLRQGKAWAWWALLLSGLAGFGSFLTYLGYGYLDVWHGLATLALLPFFLIGMALSWRRLEHPRGLRALFLPGARAWRWSPAHLGRLYVSFAAFGMLAGGLTIMAVGMTRVFVPTDLEYMGTTREALHALNPKLIPLIAHDRAGFGGGLFSGGVAIMAALWCGARPGDRKLWWALLCSGLVGFATAIGVHPIVGYTSFVHLLPAYAGALAFGVGMTYLYHPLCRLDPATRFPDLS